MCYDTIAIEYLSTELYIVIHSTYPQSRPVVITFKHVVCPSVLTLKSQEYLNVEQISSENSDCYWGNCGSGRGDHFRPHACPKQL